MPTLEFKGKQHIYAPHLTVPIAHLNLMKPAPATRAIQTITSLFTATPCMPSKLYSHGDTLHALKALLPRYATVSSASTLTHPTAPATKTGSITTT